MILILESSAPHCSVAISDVSGNELAMLRSEEQNAHAEKLPLMVQEVLKDAGMTTRDLRAVGVSGGPGSYTGLRIGTSLAKGICYALNLPLISLNGLLGLFEASVQRDTADYYVCHLDARRDEVYSEIYDANGRIFQKLSVVILTPDTYVGLNGRQIALCGNATEKILKLCNIQPVPQVFTAEPEARFLCKEASKKFNNNKFEDLAYFEPLYFKDFIPGITKKFSL